MALVFDPGPVEDELVALLKANIAEVHGEVYPTTDPHTDMQHVVRHPPSLLVQHTTLALAPGSQPAGRAPITRRCIAGFRVVVVHRNLRRTESDRETAGLYEIMDLVLDELFDLRLARFDGPFDLDDPPWEAIEDDEAKRLQAWAVNVAAPLTLRSTIT